MLSPIQKLKEENMILRKGLKDALEELNKVHFDAARSIEKLNEQASKDSSISHMQNMYDVDLNYMLNVGRYAWGERGKQIAGFYVRPVLTKTFEKLKCLH